MTIHSIPGHRTEPPAAASDGLLYSTPASKTDIRRAFREKYGWVGPEERKNLANAIHQSASAELRAVK